MEITMKNINITLMSFVAAMLFSGCANRMDSAAAESAIEQAIKTYKEVNAVGFAWRDVPAFIKKAEVALINNDMSRAVKYAKEATMQNQLSMTQYKREKNAGPH